MAKGNCLQCRRWFLGGLYLQYHGWSEGGGEGRAPMTGPVLIVYLLCGGKQKEDVDLLLTWWFSKTDQLVMHKYSMYVATRLSTEKLKSIHWLALSNCS